MKKSVTSSCLLALEKARFPFGKLSRELSRALEREKERRKKKIGEAAAAAADFCVSEVGGEREKRERERERERERVMARSRKSVRKRTSVKVTVKKKRKVKQTKALARLPLEENMALPLSGEGKSSTKWDTKRTLRRNYEDNAVAEDVNKSIGMEIDGDDEVVETHSRRTRENKGKKPKAVEDEINAALGKPRSTGRRPPKRLTTTQIKVVGKLIEKHGENIDGMARDIKLNKMQHSAGVLKKMVESYYAYPNLIGGEGKRDFHSLQKK